MDSVCFWPYCNRIGARHRPVLERYGTETDMSGESSISEVFITYNDDHVR